MNDVRPREEVGPKNPKLQSALHGFAESAIEEAARHLGDLTDLPEQLTMRIEPSEPNTLRWRRELTVDWHAVARSAVSHTRAQAAFREAEASIREDAAVSRHFIGLVHVPGTAYRMEVNECLCTFLGDLLAETGALRLEPEAFRRAYVRLEEFFYSDRVRMRALAPLQRFSMDVDEVGLSEQLRIIQLPISERERAMSEAMRTHLAGWPELPGSETCALELLWEVRKHVRDADVPMDASEDPDPTRERFDQALSALRLIRGGAVGYQYRVFESLTWNPTGFGRFGMRNAQSSLLGPTYKLTSEEVPSLRSLWNHIVGRSGPATGRLGTAIARFNSTYDRVRPEDRIIDLTIALEALLMTDNDQQELSYRLALRGAALLGDAPDQRESLFRDLRNLYHVRSRLAHGCSLAKATRKRVQAADLGRYLEGAEDLVRRAIVRFLALVGKRSEANVPSLLDSWILTGRYGDQTVGG